jgi:hypothetical protein
VKYLFAFFNAEGIISPTFRVTRGDLSKPKVARDVALAMGQVRAFFKTHLKGGGAKL